MNTSEFFDERLKCQSLIENYEQHNEPILSCPPSFDGTFCWPSTPILSLAKISCFLEGHENETVTRWCAANTSVITDSNTTIAEWHVPQYGKCLNMARQLNNVFLVSNHLIKNDSYLDWWHTNLKYLDRIGYTVSIVTLLPAIIIFLLFNQLQDTRVKVHINLFATMFFQTALALMQNLFFGCKIYYTILINESAYEEEHSTFCKTLTTLGNYFELSMFTWLLIEGWFFYSFISLAPYKTYSTVKPQMVVGWGFPFVILIPWVIIHLHYPSNFCWVDIDAKINIIAVPIFIIILINLGFFILSVRIIFIKMRNISASQKGINYWKWIKASLMLMPLFGTYDFLYGISPWAKSTQCKIYFLVIIALICSFKGCVVATLYCFTNSHVKKEVKRAWNNWKLKREIYYQKTKHHSQSNISFTDSKTYVISQKF